MSKIKLSTIKENPDNPRFISDEKLKLLQDSISDFEIMMSLRPIIIDENKMVLGGNMRLKALKALGYKTVESSWIKQEMNLTPEQKKEFIIKDNVGFGSFDWEMLEADWDKEELEEWGLDIPDTWIEEPNSDELIAENQNKPAILKITFESPEQLQKAEIDIQELIDRKYPEAFFSVSAGEL